MRIIRARVKGTASRWLYINDKGELLPSISSARNFPDNEAERFLITARSFAGPLWEFESHNPMAGPLEE